MMMAVDDCDHCTVAICQTCQFNTDGLTACHECESCCLEQGRRYIHGSERINTMVYGRKEIWGESKEDQIGTSDVPVGGIVVVE